MKKQLFFIIFVTFLSCYQFLTYISNPIPHNQESTSIAPSTSLKPRILLLNLIDGLGGQEMHLFTLYNMLHKHGYHVTLLMPTQAKLGKLFNEHKLPYYQTHVNKIKWFRPLFYRSLAACIKKICTDENINIIHCNNPFEIRCAQDAGKTDTKILFSLHAQELSAVEKIKNIDALIAVNKSLVETIDQYNQNYKRGIKNICYLPPFFNIDRLLMYKQTESKHEFFSKNFKITITDKPIISMVGNFYKNPLYKNHPLLLKAIHNLIYNKNKYVQVIFAGDGERRPIIEQLVHTLKLEKYVHFLGFTNKIPDILYHSDIVALTSSKEAFGLVLAEAGIMKKPTIGSYETGAESIIVNEQTGLLFKNNNVDDLEKQLERLLDNPLWAKRMGNQAYDHVMQNFAPEVLFAEYEKLYHFETASHPSTSSGRAVYLARSC